MKQPFVATAAIDCIEPKLPFPFGRYDRRLYRLSKISRSLIELKPDFRRAADSA
jgi:hypothetical protein